MMSEQKIYVGLDIRNDITQIAVLGPGLSEPEILTAAEGETEFLTEVLIPGTNECIRGFVNRILNQEPVMAAQKESDPVNVMAAFLRRTLAVTRKRYPGDMIRGLVVTTESRDFRFISVIYRALAKLGIEKDRAMVVDRRQSYIYYVMSQKRELWVNHVGLFDYRLDNLTYYQMQTDRFQRPAVVTVGEKDYSEYLEALGETGGTPEERSAVFEGMVQGAIHGQVITTLYMTGDGFEDGFADDVMKKLCVGRHLFRGDNLYVQGACYLAREMSGAKKMDDFIYLDDDMVPVNLTIRVYTEAKSQEIYLVRAGMPWYQVDHETDLIPDGDEELELTVQNVMTGEKTFRLIPMEGIPGRLERKTRIGLQLRFAGVDKCIVTVRDKGFGESFPSSCRIWEKTITI